MFRLIYCHSPSQFFRIDVMAYKMNSQKMTATKIYHTYLSRQALIPLRYSTIDMPERDPSIKAILRHIRCEIDSHSPTLFDSLVYIVQSELETLFYGSQVVVADNQSILYASPVSPTSTLASSEDQTDFKCSPFYQIMKNDLRMS